MTTKIYLTINGDLFEKIKKRAEQASKDNNSEEKGELFYENAELLVNDFYLNDDEDTITLNGEINCFGENFAWIDLTIPLNQELAIQIVDRYMKKLGKLKTVLEATK